MKKVLLRPPAPLLSLASAFKFSVLASSINEEVVTDRLQKSNVAISCKPFLNLNTTVSAHYFRNPFHSLHVQQRVRRMWGNVQTLHFPVRFWFLISSAGQAAAWLLLYCTYSSLVATTTS
jgi:chemotaxis methyl-accepting protein methylase